MAIQAHGEMKRIAHLHMVAAICPRCFRVTLFFRFLAVMFRKLLDRFLIGFIFHIIRGSILGRFKTAVLYTQDRTSHIMVLEKGVIHLADDSPVQAIAIAMIHAFLQRQRLF